MEKQEFEKYPELTTHIRRMALKGNTLSPSEWSDFLRTLNSALSHPSMSIGGKSWDELWQEYNEYMSDNKANGEISISRLEWLKYKYPMPVVSSPITIEEAKDRVAKKYNYGSWEDLVYLIGKNAYLEKYTNEAMQLYKDGK